MTGHWGYPAEPDKVQMGVPEDLVEAVGAMIADPEAFFASLQRTEAALGTMLIEVDSGVWVDPTRIVAVRAIDGFESRVYLDGADVVVDGDPETILKKIAAKLSEGRSILDDIAEGAPPA